MTGTRDPAAALGLASSPLGATAEILPIKLIARAQPSVVRAFLASLTRGKQYASLSIVCVGLLQISLLGTMLVRLALQGPASLTSGRAIGALILLLLGTVLELIGVVYILLPASHSHHEDDIPSFRSSDSNSNSAGVHSMRLDPRHAYASLRSFTEASQSRNSSQTFEARSDTAHASLPEARSGTGMTSPIGSSEWSELGWRMEALANLRVFMLGLDRQASAEFFVQGAANAIQGIFPGVSHASFCLLNANRTSVNVYTFLGEGARKAPYTSVAVVPGTLIFYVINTCHSVFIPNIAAFQRPYSDLQFMRYVMGLHSMSCLPLVTSQQQQQQVLGVLRLGFEEPRAWEEPEKRLAEELALVLSSSSLGLAASASPPPPAHLLAPPRDSSRRSSTLTDLSSLPLPADAPQQPSGLSSPSGQQQLPEPAVVIQYYSGSPLDSSGQNAMPSDATSCLLPGWDHIQPLYRTDSSEQFDLGPAAPAACEQPDYELKRQEIIGRGAFGSVFRAIWMGKLVAVKVVEHGDDLQGCCDTQAPCASSGASARRAALLEGAMTLTLKHPNVVQTYDFRVLNLHPTARGAQGLTLDSVQQETHIIMELCDRGSLQDAISRGAFSCGAADRPGGGGGAVNMELVTMSLAEVALALAYLHAHRITHRDLKPKNILLKASSKDERGFRCLVSDFGLSQVLPEDDVNMRTMVQAGTVTHMPPELIEDGKVYQQGDAYAFGVVMWELFTAAAPYPGMTQVQIMVAVVTHGLRPKFPDSCPEWYKSLANKCWRKDPMSRPSFQEISNYLLTMVSDKSWSAVGEGGAEAQPSEAAQHNSSC